MRVVCTPIEPEVVVTLSIRTSYDECADKSEETKRIIRDLSIYIEWAPLLFSSLSISLNYKGI